MSAAALDRESPQSQLVGYAAPKSTCLIRKADSYQERVVE